MRTHLKKKDQILGCILGGALGDAWGGPCEGKPGRVSRLRFHRGHRVRRHAIHSGYMLVDNRKRVAFTLGLETV